MLSCDLGSIIFCARQQTRLAERAGQKIVFQRQLSDLGVQGLHIDVRLRLSLGGLSEHTGCSFKKLVAPLLDLVRMNIKFLRQFDQCLLALDRGHRRFRLECRAMVPAWSSSHGLLLARSVMLLLRGKST
jgi:hypothetical protein